MLGAALLAGVEAGLNKVLALDATALPRLAALQGRVIAVDCTAPALRLFLLPGADGLRLAGHWEAPADCTLRAPAGRLLELAVHRDKSAVLHAPDVELDGHSACLLDLAAILQDLELDWEGALAEWLGPLGAVALARPLQGAGQWSGDALASLRLNLADWLAEEARLLAGRQEAEARFAELDDLKLALDRLEARSERLARRLEDH
ncbi:ubiquinone biosynthesis accessory factor UbiJ [Geopseudomonas guangdongensis]|uniref:Ubiquinone biosynthesis accessory factor UbiJ n=1 Tax=Geopseudomonas guangdongensis TaxID=1245526 RepID=A0A1H2EB01_9GAMM|nr:SCP2 sterol-binding domain-containing protein [Pseudomonas guangdongensis]SDT92302.1 ubiquinone biosynthesis protein UbiJ [Pseudomonas guangdongensis]